MTNNFWELKHGFILASASPQRKRLLEQIRLFPDEIISPDIDESVLKGELPRQYVKRIATQKAQAVFNTHTGKCVVAADTVLAVGRHIIRKAQNEDEARANLLLLSGRKHQVLTGLCVMTPEGKAISRVSATTVTMKRLSQKDIEFIIKSAEYKGVAGYRIEGIISAFVKQMNGSFDSVVGLPLYETAQILRGIAGS